MKLRPKKPAFADTLAAGLGAKKPSFAVDPVAFKRQQPAWRISLLHHDGDMGWLSCSGAEFWAQVCPRLKAYEGMTWGQIEQDKHNHSWEIGDLQKPMRDRYATVKRRDEFDTIYQLHVNARGRIWGWRAGHLFYILWWDSEHDGHKTEPKNS